MQGNILVAEDELLARKNICRVLVDEGYQVHEAADGSAAIEAVDKNDLDLILLDLKMPGADGMTVLKHVRQASPQTLVLIMTAYASIETSVEALRLGAQDYILKPIVLDGVLKKVRTLMENKRLAWEIQTLRRQLNRDFESTELIGNSLATAEILEVIEKVAPTNSTVLISGESGVGKEVVARTIHKQSTRSDKTFLAVNCSAIPETLLESQLFGHVKGAFTGASNYQEGLFQRANGGTIFLDEIGEMPLILQPKILRAIEERAVTPIGAAKPLPVDVRIIAATNRTLKQEVDEGKFRGDLYYRLNVIHLDVPPLRERREDIPLLVEHFIRRQNSELKKNYQGVESSALKVLMSLPWKGNIRDLNNVLERAMILGNGDWITVKDLPRWEVPEVDTDRNVGHGHDLRRTIRAFEKSHIENVLKETDGDRTQTAELLGLSRSSLYRKLEALGIES
ncbi:MAG: sigma-54 dependent transcriptional regulator [Candidatus Binatota bacterium]|nr:sigma-54 dependent transcriptional regulator [Candidatus Binatota bacterium]